MPGPALKGLIKGFTTFGGKVIDLAPTQVMRKVGKEIVEEAPQSIARIVDDADAAKSLDRMTGNTTAAKLRKYTAQSTNAIEGLQDIAPMASHTAEMKPLAGKLNARVRDAGNRRTSKLNASIVKMMREQHASGAKTIEELADEWGVKKETARDAILKYTWPHVE